MLHGEEVSDANTIYRTISTVNKSSLVANMLLFKLSYINDS